MSRMMIRWLVGVIALLLTGALAHALGIELKWDPPWAVIVFVPVLTIVNAVIGPILGLLTLPINCLTFGLFSFVINALLFYGAGRATGGQMNAWGALFGSIVYGILSTVMSWSVKERQHD